MTELVDLYMHLLEDTGYFCSVTAVGKLPEFPLEDGVLRLEDHIDMATATNLVDHLHEHVPQDLNSLDTLTVMCSHLARLKSKLKEETND